MTKDRRIVFPAYAGMFRYRNLEYQTVRSVPRIRGDVSATNMNNPIQKRCSPHTRGCFGFSPPFGTPVEVFPAYAGMFRCVNTSDPKPCCVPRIRGDVSVHYLVLREFLECSPHTRGCFVIHAPLEVEPRRVPRIRGDVSYPRLEVLKTATCSPHTRGCFVHRHRFPRRDSVFPAYAGMFRRMGRLTVRVSCVPRIRGDVSGKHNLLGRAIVCSPHTRGCFEFKTTWGENKAVFPAYAGMFRFYRCLCLPKISVPRIRGDVSALPTRSAPCGEVFPAYAGMFRS